MGIAILVLLIWFIVISIHVSARRDIRINAKLDLLLSQNQLDHNLIRVPEEVHAKVSSCLNTQYDPLFVDKQKLRKKAINDAVSCLVEELFIPRQTAEAIIRTKYNIHIPERL